MCVKTGKAVSKILESCFFLLGILKGAFPKAAFALSTNACARDIRCVQLLKESFKPAVAAPIARRDDEIGILVVPTGTFIPLYRWSQGTTVRAQLQSRQKYCTTYPSDSVCVPFTAGQCPVLYTVYSKVWNTATQNEYSVQAHPITNFWGQLEGQERIMPLAILSMKIAIVTKF